MQQLLGDQAAEANQTFLRELFLQRLPANVRMVLACSDATMSIAALADMADKVMEVSTPTIAAVSPSPPFTASEVQQLKEQMSRLTELVATLTQQRRPRRSRSFHRRGRSFSRSRAASPASTGSTQQERTQDTDSTSKPLCWYHHKYGESAHRCIEPCNWGNGQAGH